MSKILEILGRGVDTDLPQLISHWLDVVKQNYSMDNRQVAKITSLQNVFALLEGRKIETARQKIRLYLFEHPECPAGRLTSAAFCIYHNELQKAIDELNSAYMRQPSNTMVLYALGYCYERLGHQPQAIEFFQDCLKFKNFLILPRLRLAAIYLHNARLEKTIYEYKQLNNEYPGDLHSLVLLGSLQLAAGQFDDAIETFENAILIHPDNFQSDYHQLNELICKRQFYQALEFVDNLINENSNIPELLAKRADILAEMDSIEDAIKQYNETIEICPQFLEANIKLGSLYLQTGQTRQAAVQFNNAADINDNIVDAYIGLATAKKLKGNDSDALDTLSLAAAIDENSTYLLTETARLQLKSSLDVIPGTNNEVSTEKVTQDIIDVYKKQLADCPADPCAWYRLGIFFTYTKQNSEAAETFRRALQINHTFDRANNKLAILLFESDRKQEAIEQLDRPQFLDRDTLNLHYKTALLYCDSIKFATSLMNLASKLENNLTSAATTLNVSAVLQNLGLLERSSETWDSLQNTAEKIALNNQAY